MKTMILSSSVVVLGSLALAAGCSQPPPTCQVSPALPYAAKFAQTSSDDGSTCSGLSGDQIGLASYAPANADRTAPDLNKPSTFAIRTELLGSLVATASDNGVADAAEDDAPFSLGVFKDLFPDANDICTPGAMAPAHQVLDAIPGDDGGTPDDDSDDIPPQDAVDMQEEWSGVQVYVTAAAIGTQMKGHYTLTDNAAGCSAEYDVLGMFPAVDCSDVDADGNAIANPDFCSPVAIPDKGIAVGSGINPDFPTKCEEMAGSFFCVLDADPSTAKLPVLKK